MSIQTCLILIAVSAVVYFLFLRKPNNKNKKDNKKEK